MTTRELLTAPPAVIIRPEVISRMPSPFPGMDPYIEGVEWPNFHVSMIVAIRDQLVPPLRPRYIVRSEERVYVEHEMDDPHARVIIPDLTIADSLPGPPRISGGRTAVAEIEPVTITLPASEPTKERFLTIRKRESLEVVTVVEVLSPTNKRDGSEEHAIYLAKRDDVLRAGVHLVEIDLLRGGKRLPAEARAPAADYYAIVSRGHRLFTASVYPWSLRRSLPPIPIPLAEGDPDVILDLQAAFDTVYDRAGYDYSLDYTAPVEPPLSKEDVEWAEEILRAKGRS